MASPHVPSENPYQVEGASHAEPHLGAEDAFRRVNRAARRQAVGQALLAAGFLGMVALFALYSREGAGVRWALVVRAGLGAGTYLYRQSRTWLRLGEGGLRVGGQYVPWSEVFFLQPVHYGAPRGRRFLYLAFSEGQRPRMICLHRPPRDDGWLAAARERTRPEEDWTAAECELVERLLGRPVAPGVDGAEPPPPPVRFT